jgi:ketosteroid isomerase-like protein
MKQIVAAAVSGLCVITFTRAQDPASTALDAMVNAERAFAKTATVKGIRDSFLEFFADDALAFNPKPVSATERLRSRPGRPFSELELTWEPRTGDIAASSELGWLTGPSTFVDHTTPGSAPQPGNYLSVWRRRSSGPWRVFIDIGSQPPQAVSFAPGFTRFQLPSRYTGGEPASAATASLLGADQRLNAQIAERGPGPAYEGVVSSASRLHRSGFMPSIGPKAIRSWLDGNASGMTASTGTAESAQSGDLGYSYGTFEVKGTSPLSGAYVRVWQRDGAGTWWLVADVVQKS